MSQEGEAPSRKGGAELARIMDAGWQLQRTGKFVEAEALYLRLLDTVPDYAPAVARLALVAFQVGRHERALEVIEGAIGLDGSLAHFHELHGRVLKQLGRSDAAEAAYRRALAIGPQTPSCWVSLGILLKSLARVEEAVDCHRRALALDPEFVEAHHNLGTALALLGDEAGARAHLERAAKPRHTRAGELQRQAAALRAEGRYVDAVPLLRAALQMAPELTAIQCDLGYTLMEMAKLDEAAALIEPVLNAAPDDEVVAINLASIYSAQSRTEESSRLYRSVAQRRRDDGLRMRDAMLLPVVCRSQAHIESARDRFQRELEALLHGPLHITDPLDQPGATSFELAYHGRNDRSLQELLARVALRATPDLAWVAPQLARPRPRRMRLRVGFLSKYLFRHSIGRTSAGLMAELARDRFEVIALFVPPRTDDDLSARIRREADGVVDLPPTLVQARAAIADLDLDVLFYQDIGMEPFSYYLAHARLAPVQCVSFGHPNTTGIPNMDYFVSSALFEPSETTGHYSETLYTIDDAGTLAYYYMPARGANARTRAHYDLADSAHVYLCPQTLFKFHPEFDALLLEILRRDPRGVLVLIEGWSRHWHEQLMARFAAEAPEVTDRIRFLPRLPYKELLELYANADVVLDTIHFNGMNTSLEAFAVGVPIVTLPSAFQRGRHTAGMYRRMGYTDLIAADAADYVRLALALANEPECAATARTAIAERRHVLFEDRGVLHGFEAFFEWAVQQPVRY